MGSRRIAWLGLVIGCGSAPTAARVAPEPPPPAPGAPPPLPTRGVVARPIPVLDEPRVVEDAPKLVRVIAGSLRAELTPDGVALAADRFGFAIVAAARTASGWVFVAADGTFARADSFTGSLVRLDDVPREPWKPAVMPATCGRVAVGGGDVLYSSDGGPVSARKAPGDVIGAAFADARHGMIVVDGGALYETRDAGATFARVDLGDDAAAAVRCESGALRVDTLAASLVFAPDGTRAVSPRPAAAVLAADLRFAVDRAALRAYPEVAEQLGGVRTGDGSALFFRGDRLVPHLPDDPDRRRVRRCTTAPWGEDVALLCNRKLSRVDRGGGEHVVADEVGSPVLSDDGRHAMWDCTPPAPRGTRPGPRTRCVYTDGKVTRQPGSFSVAVMHGSQVVDGHWDKLAIADLDTGATVRTVAIAQPPGTTWFEHFRLSGDGSIVFADAAAPTGTTTVRVELAAGDATFVPLPTGATRSGFADARRGIAAGHDRASLRDDDGGARGLPLAALVDGAMLARPQRWGISWLPGWSLDCTRDRCVVDGRVIVDFDVVVAAPPRVLASRLPIAAPPVPPAPPSFACKLGASRPGPAGAGTGDRVDRGHVRYVTPSARIDLAIAGTSLAASWDGRDVLGAYRARSAGTVARVDDATYELRHVSRRGVAVLRSGGGRADRIWIPASGRPAVVDERGIAVDSLALPDGRVLALGDWVPAAYSHDGHLDFAHAILLDATGAAAARAIYSPFEEGRSRYAAVIDGVPGTASVDEREGRPTRFVALTGEPHAVPAIAGLPVCRGTQPATTIVPIFDGRAKGRDRLVVDRVYLHDDACIAAVELHDPYAGGRGRHAYATATDAGELAGEVLGDGTVEPIACTP